MDHTNSIMITPVRERGQHLTFEDRCCIKVYMKMGFSLRRIGEALDCAASTVLNEIRRGTGVRNGDRGRFPEYSARRGQANYKINRSRCHKPHKLSCSTPFIEWLTVQVKERQWSLDRCVGYARRHMLFPEDQILSAKTLYNELHAGNLPLTLFDLPEVLSRKKKNKATPRNKRNFGRSIEERPEEAVKRIVCGHWEIDTVIGHRNGRESVVLTLVEKKTDFYLAIKIPGKNSESVMAALEVLREEYGAMYFPTIFKTITADNGSEFEGLSQLEKYGVGVYFAHPYCSSERAQNERHNRIFRRYVPKRKSIENYSADQILRYADEMNALPRKILGYNTPEELFDSFLDEVYSLTKQKAC